MIVERDWKGQAGNRPKPTRSGKGGRKLERSDV